MKDDNVVFSSEINQFDIEAVRCQGRRGVVGIGDNHKLGSSRNIGGNILKTDHIVILFLLRHEIELGAGQQRSICEHRVAGIRDKN
ncbi:hypothetical protein D3C85_1685850 [compost metagenome]